MGRILEFRSIAVAVLVGLLWGCAPTMIERGGARVFNPAYIRFLESDRRDSWQKPEEVVAALALPEGAIVADIGAGGGYFSRRFSKSVGPNGLVYATDVQEEMIRELNTRVIDKGYENVRIVHSAFDDPLLPDACCDLVFFGAVYKEIRERTAYMANLHSVLRSGARVAIIGFPPDGSFMGPPRDVRLSEKQVIEELAQAGFVLTERHDFLPMQYFLVFQEAAPAGTGAVAAKQAMTP